MLAKVHCAKCVGIEVEPVTVEVDISPGIGIHIIGMPDTAIKESVMRVSTALRSGGFRIPGHRIVVNLAPADVRKSGAGYDLAIALGIITASGQAPAGRLERFMVMGELGLDGSLRSITGAVPMARYSEDAGFEGIVLPRESAVVASAIRGRGTFYADSISDVLNILNEEAFRERHDTREALSAGRISPVRDEDGTTQEEIPDFSCISGQQRAKRAVEIAAAGGHNMLMIGTPGSGKTLLARAMQGIMPPLSEEEALETEIIYSVSGTRRRKRTVIPFRSPHHNITVPSLLGGGTEARPGEVSLAHNGILFLDEIAEMPSRVLDALREPLEDGKVTISRLRHKILYPSRFQLVAASNPCPCGYYGEGEICKCTEGRVRSYLSRLTGPFLDRIDIRIYLPPVESARLSSGAEEEDSAAVALRVASAREMERHRFAGTQARLNAGMGREELERFCRLGAAERQLCESVINRYRLSARGYHKLLKVARTIADLDGREEICKADILEAAGLRTTGWFGG